MFTGIIETIGEVVSCEANGSNLDLVIQSSLSNQLKVDESVAHNGVCLTVTEVNSDSHQVTVIKESIDRSNLGELSTGSKVNLERAMLANERLDGHIVQGHVDRVTTCIEIENLEGSRYYWFDLHPEQSHLVVEKGSITIDGVSLTIANLESRRFAVAIIPYTFDNTRFCDYTLGTKVNLEFDIIGKYVARMMEGYKQ